MVSVLHASLISCRVGFVLSCFYKRSLGRVRLIWGTADRGTCGTWEIAVFYQLQSWTKVLGTVLQYSYFSVISRFPLKRVHHFGNFLAVLPRPNPIQSWNSQKNSGYTRPTLSVRWGEGSDMSELETALETQKCPKTFVHDCLKSGEKKKCSFEGLSSL